MRDAPRSTPTRDLDSPEEVGLAQHVARVHSHRLIGVAVSLDPKGGSSCSAAAHS